MQGPVPGNKPSSGGGFGRAVLLLLLALFSVTSFIAFVLAAVSACKYPKENDVIVRNPLLYIDTTRLPFVFLAFMNVLGWAVPLIAVLMLATKVTSHNHRFARYVFKIAAVFTAIFLVIFYFSWTATSLTFLFPLAAKWRSGTAAVIMAHINLFIVILLTLMAAVFDTPKDSKPEGPGGPMGPGSRTPSQAY
ncbi:hypothetical protein FLAG1_07781 [Fusarium langsethiae]|uniref:Uncharacterized protein n=1 Tax=Fusarium langsethiae TaxID=179993 RepID=A0A0N0V604_FUSLA|nr:hypothetical protein FLAG1_07781 [Fusarium langsethiae]GKU03926.1 unnamed protein product [Fusarium langsethiae]GKU18860.1 unnamed protein product [Fusarium langsethiae]